MGDGNEKEKNVKRDKEKQMNKKEVVSQQEELSQKVEKFEEQEVHNEGAKTKSNLMKGYKEKTKATLRGEKGTKREQLHKGLRSGAA